MARLHATFFAISLLFAGCGASQRAPSTTPPEQPAEPAEPGQEAASDMDASGITYMVDTERVRVYLPLDSPICQTDETAQPLYQVESLRVQTPETDQWNDLEVASDAGWRISCNAMLNLEDVLGFDLEPGTYEVVALIDGSPEPSTFVVE